MMRDVGGPFFDVGGPFFDSMGIIYIYWVPTGITVNKEYYIEVLRGSSGRDSIGRGQNSSNQVGGISIRTMPQSTTPFLSQTI